MPFRIPYSELVRRTVLYDLILKELNIQFD
jgi:hypothetical protein